MEPFVVKLPLPGVAPLPIVLSCPHVGTELPAEVAATMRPEIVRTTPDTDWFVHQLYEFAPRIGVTLIHARYSRLAIDLNRDLTGKKLYADGRAETNLCPTRTFALAEIYLPGKEPDAEEITRRTKIYYAPYHEKIRGLLDDIKKRRGAALLYEAHSIQRFVPSIRPQLFDDLILGDQQGKTAAPQLAEAARRILGDKGSGYKLSYNTPFMGGYLTRSFGKPEAGIHALQLEMSQDVYMDEANVRLDEAKLARIRPVLERNLRELGRLIIEIGQ